MKDLLNAVSKKGAREILASLKGSAKRFGQLSKLVKRSRRTLAKRLKELEDEGLVRREVTEARPPETWYTLTPKGEKALSMISKLEGMG